MRKKTKEILTRGLACFAAIELTFFQQELMLLKHWQRTNHKTSLKQFIFGVWKEEME